MTVSGWYLIFCKYGRMEQAEDSLEKIGITTFCPMMTREKKRAGSQRIKVSVEPMFPPYLFVKIDADLINTARINALPGVSYIVKFGREPRPLPQSLIEALMRRACNHSLTDDQVNNDHNLMKMEERLEKIKDGNSYGLLSFLHEMIMSEIRLNRVE
ncbi:transcriptional activator RfaH [Erwinia persicina]|uniref:transcriptional activator RfaH n=1 Tax=Erwinia persicina TaxID=55211 RepID=UPI00177D2474|nr:transcriptional activator RfaH [Erwinia persicina]MBD8164941.1 transcriptional activator RfaH [Erwinia persicina]MBD8216325.1 transcriptional activator RfaH [Erwinia persicina]